MKASKKRLRYKISVGTAARRKLKHLLSRSNSFLIVHHLYGDMSRKGLTLDALRQTACPHYTLVLSPILCESVVVHSKYNNLPNIWI